MEVEREYGGYAARQVQVFCRYLYAQQAKRTEHGVVCEQPAHASGFKSAALRSLRESAPRAGSCMA